MKALIGVLAFLPLIAWAQQTAVTLKPVSSVWQLSDVASAELRIKGRLATDSTTTHKIIARIPVKPFDWITLATMRATVLVPAGQVWEVKSLALGITPAKTSGLAAFEIATQPFPIPHQAPGGQQLAIDVGVSTGIVVLGPVSSAPLPPPIAAISIGSSIADNETIRGVMVWTASPSVVPLRVEFFVDGAASPPESLAPYQHDGDPNGRLDTTKMANGTHKLLIKVFLKDGTSHSREITVTVAN